MTQIQFKDHFSDVSNDYAKYRPNYPDALAHQLASLLTEHHIALDCGCGTGQFSVTLSPYFQQVIATDASQSQITQAVPCANIEYRVAPAESSGLKENSVDLITVAQAAHWLDLDAFYKEVHKIAKPRAVLALITYGVFYIDEQINPYLQYFYANVIGRYWPPERKHVEDGYQNLNFPFDEMTLEPIVLTEFWNFYQLIGYIGTWSAVKEARKILENDPLAVFAQELLLVWGDPIIKKQIHWPVSVRVGRVTTN